MTFNGENNEILLKGIREDLSKLRYLINEQKDTVS